MKNPNENNILIQQKYKKFFEMYIYYLRKRESESGKFSNLRQRDYDLWYIFIFQMESFFETPRESFVYFGWYYIYIIIIIIGQLKVQTTLLEFGLWTSNWMGAVWTGELFGSAHLKWVGTKKKLVFFKKLIKINKYILVLIWDNKQVQILNFKLFCFSNSIKLYTFCHELLLCWKFST